MLAISERKIMHKKLILGLIFVACFLLVNVAEAEHPYADEIERQIDIAKQGLPTKYMEGKLEVYGAEYDREHHAIRQFVRVLEWDGAKVLRQSEGKQQFKKSWKEQILYGNDPNTRMWRSAIQTYDVSLTIIMSDPNKNHIVDVTINPKDLK